MNPSPRRPAAVLVLALGGLALLRGEGDAPAEATRKRDPLVADGEVAATLVLGPAAAPHRLVVFTDYQCPACAQLERDAGASLRALALEGRLRLEVRHFPLAAHRRAGRAAAMAVCAARQGKGWEMHEALLRSASRWSSGKPSDPWFHTLSDSLGLVAATLSACLRDPELPAVLAADQRLGATANVREVPALFLDGTALSVRTPRDLVRRASEGTR